MATAFVDDGGNRMLAATFPGDSTVALGWHDVPTPGAGQVLLRTAASAICGSDLHTAYRHHLDRGDRTYTGCIGGHEFAGTVEAVGPGVRTLDQGQLVIVYHVAGCGQCTVCRSGYMIHCESPYRRAYGNQRDGGHAPFVLADAVTCIPAPAAFTGMDASLIGCGFGTAFEGLHRVRVDGRDAVLVVGLGPVGLAAAMVARAMGARRVLGAELHEARRAWAQRVGLFDDVFEPAQTPPASCDVAVDASGSPAGRLLALRSLRTWGRCAFIGEGGDVTFDVSADLLHKEIMLSGSWVTSVPNMARCADVLASHGLHPEIVVEHRLPLDAADRAYQLAADQTTGKVCLVFDEAHTTPTHQPLTEGRG